MVELLGMVLLTATVEPIGMVRAMVRALTVLDAMVEAGVGLALTLGLGLGGGVRARALLTGRGEASRE